MTQLKFAGTNKSTPPDGLVNCRRWRFQPYAAASSATATAPATATRAGSRIDLQKANLSALYPSSNNLGISFSCCIVHVVNAHPQISRLQTSKPQTQTQTSQHFISWTAADEPLSPLASDSLIIPYLDPDLFQDGQEEEGCRSGRAQCRQCLPVSVAVAIPGAAAITAFVGGRFLLGLDRSPGPKDVSNGEATRPAAAAGQSRGPHHLP